eukprot:CAMPEP_0202902128 /NCGR_PEP_ID=MMETSP1392-20130828/16518_1 /ASSEMBLY_ACC=CAM_ASM_000868 /TAXON_ID=225041 /ORGANISM="Chlamydomonas chlamydogama, Strain SAG 11-48b" /LENGTH=117 /DNA_ID=CAMNT_0049588843 /DNA_START=120 /DNA_END=469 /DNA_ORIENTATION=+
MAETQTRATKQHKESKLATAQESTARNNTKVSNADALPTSRQGIHQQGTATTSFRKELDMGAFPTARLLSTPPTIWHNLADEETSCPSNLVNMQLEETAQELPQRMQIHAAKNSKPN